MIAVIVLQSIDRNRDAYVRPILFLILLQASGHQTPKCISPQRGSSVKMLIPKRCGRIYKTSVEIWLATPHEFSFEESSFEELLITRKAAIRNIPKENLVHENIFYLSISKKRVPKPYPATRQVCCGRQEAL